MKKYITIIDIMIIIILLSGTLLLSGKNLIETDDIKFLLVHSVYKTKIIPFNKLQKSDNIGIKGVLGITEIRYDGDGVSVIKSPCTNKICINRGVISGINESIICLPNRVMIMICTKTELKKYIEFDAVI